jgi:hypothetical protein
VAQLANTRESGDTDQAKTNLHAQQRWGIERKKQKKLFKKALRNHAIKQSTPHILTGIPPLTRATPLHSVTLRAVNIMERKIWRTNHDP